MSLCNEISISRHQKHGENTIEGISERAELHYNNTIILSTNIRTDIIFFTINNRKNTSHLTAFCT